MSWQPSALGGAGALLIASGLLGPSGATAKGPPAPRPKCEGSESPYCSNGRIDYHCCPEGARCNYAYQPYVTCDYGCVAGSDPGRCPSLHPMTQPGKTKATCDQGSWQTACVGRKVTEACIGAMHTNYSGPPLNPQYRTCGDDRCTTSRYLEDCYPTRRELGKKDCVGAWTKVCLMGKAEDRCVPKGTDTATLAATKFVKCGESSCAIGTDANACRTDD